MKAAGEDVVGFGAGEPDFRHAAAHQGRLPKALAAGFTNTRRARASRNCAKAHRRQVQTPRTA